MSNVVVQYWYSSYDLGCGCCSDSDSYINVWVDGKLVEDERWFSLILNEEELREEISAQYPQYNGFEVHEDTQYF